MDVSSCPSRQALPQKPFNQTTTIKPDHCSIPGRFHPLSFIHSFIHFPLLQRFKPTNYHQLPPDGLCPCSCFSWPFKQPCINKPVVTNKKGGERLLFKALLREREGAHVSHPGRVKAQPAIYGAVQGPGMGTNKGGREAVMFQDMKRVQTKYTQNRWLTGKGGCTQRNSILPTFKIFFLHHDSRRLFLQTF